MPGAVVELFERAKVAGLGRGRPSAKEKFRGRAVNASGTRHLCLAGALQDGGGGTRYRNREPLASFFRGDAGQWLAFGE